MLVGTGECIGVGIPLPTSAEKRQIDHGVPDGLKNASRVTDGEQVFGCRHGALTHRAGDSVAEPLASPSGLWILARWVNGPGNRWKYARAGDEGEPNGDAPFIFSENRRFSPYFPYGGHGSLR